MIAAKRCVESPARFVQGRAGSGPAAAWIDRGGVELIECWARDWRELCTESVDDQPFYRPEWIAAHMRAFTPEASVLLFTVKVKDRLCLILPLLEERALFCGLPVRRLRAPVNGHSCRFDAVRRRGWEGELAVRVLWQRLKDLPGWDLLEFDAISVGGTVSTLSLLAEGDGFGTGQIAKSPSPYVSLPAELPMNKKLRSQLRGIRAKLAKQGVLRLRRIASADPTVLQRFYELEAAGWKGTRGSAIACTPAARRFYNEIAIWAERFGCLSIYELELEGRLLAAHFGLSYGGRYFSPKIAYDESMKSWAPGHLIVEEIVRDCVERGLEEYDITGQYDAWKAKWTAQTRPECMQYIFSKGFVGRAGRLARFCVRPRVKKMVDMVMRRIAAISKLKTGSGRQPFPGSV